MMQSSQRNFRKQVLGSLLIQKEKDYCIICQSWKKEAAFQGADSWSERPRELFEPEYQLKPNDGRRLSSLLKKLKDHDCTLLHANGIPVNHGEKFHHDFSVAHIASVEAK